MKRDTDRYSLSPMEQKRRELFIQKSSRVAAGYLRRIEQLGEMPETLRPFLQVLKGIFADFQDVPHGEGRKTVGSFCVMVPPELIEAAGAVPLRLCSGSYTAYSIGDDVVPRDACPLVKAVIGSMELRAVPLYDRCSLMIIPVTCDCKKNLAGMLKERKPTAILQVPVSKEEDGEVEQYLRELYRLIPVLEQAAGGKVTARSLAESINRRGYAQYEMCRFFDFKKMSPPLLYGTQVMLSLIHISEPTRH